MAQHYDFKIMMAAKMTRLLNRVVQPMDLAFGVPSTPSVPNGRNTVVSVTAGDDTRRVAYDRYSIASTISKMPSDRTLLKLTSTDPTDILPRVNSKLGLNFQPSDFEHIEPVNGFMEFKFAAGNLACRGTFTLPYYIPGASRINFDHRWELKTDADNTGIGSDSLPGTWSFNEPVAGQGSYGNLGGGAAFVPFPNGVELPLTGNFVYDFEIIITLNMSYLCTLSTNGAGNGSVASTLGSLYFATGRAYLYGITQATNAPTIPINTPQRFTIVGLDGMLYLYHRGMLIESVAQPATAAKFVGFRNAEVGVNQLGQYSYIRNFNVLLHRPTADELFYILNGEVETPIFPPPTIHAFSIAGDYTNRGSDGGVVNSGIPAAKFLNKPWFGGSSLGTLSLGQSLNFTGDFTVDVEIAAAEIGDVYGILFSRNTNPVLGNNVVAGDLLTWRNLVGKQNTPTLYLMGYSSAADVPLSALSATTSVRMTIVRAGSTVRWYENGVLKWTFNSATNFTWNNFVCARSLTYFRNLRFWKVALVAEQLNNLFTYRT